jgi:hypothetical protein
MSNQRRKTTTRIKKNPVSQKIIKPLGESIIPSKTFHETFPITLEFKDDKEKKVCCFQCQEHLDTYLSRHKLKKKDYKVSKTLPKNEKET